MTLPPSTRPPRYKARHARYHPTGLARWVRLAVSEVRRRWVLEVGGRRALRQVRRERANGR